MTSLNGCHDNKESSWILIIWFFYA